MTAIKVLTELFPKATIPLASVQATRALKLSAGALLSEIDDETDAVNFILITVRKIVSFDQ